MLYLSNPPGITTQRRRAMLDDVAALNRLKFADYHDSETQARIDQYEMAFLMQAAVPDLVDLSKEPGMLDDTRVIWGGGFGRTVYSQGVLTRDNHGHDHHPRC